MEITQQLEKKQKIVLYIALLWESLAAHQSLSVKGIDDEKRTATAQSDFSGMASPLVFFCVISPHFLRNKQYLLHGNGRVTNPLLDAINAFRSLFGELTMRSPFTLFVYFGGFFFTRWMMVTLTFYASLKYWHVVYIMYRVGQTERFLLFSHNTYFALISFHIQDIPYIVHENSFFYCSYLRYTDK